MKKDDIIGVIMLVIALAVIGGFLFLAPKASELVYGPVDIVGSTLSAFASNDSEVAVAGNIVRPGFVTIHESVGLAPGLIIGTSAIIPAGAASADVISLTSPMSAGLTYIALLHVDNGDGVFVTADDMPVTSNGMSVRSDFVLSVPDEIEKE